jgi:phenylacetate-CoA ligase
MPDFYDRYEHRTPGSREASLFRDLRSILSVGKSRTSTLRAQLKGIAIDALKTRADLAQIPVMRRSQLRALQKDLPPFGGACAKRPGALLRLLVSPDMISYPEGQGKDWWGAARALFAAGIRKSDIVLSCFSESLIVEPWMIESGARALGVAIIPARPGNMEFLREVVAHVKPGAFCGDAENLKACLAKNSALRSRPTTLRCALVPGRGVLKTAKEAISAHGIAVFEAYTLGEVGIVAFETVAHEGLIVNEGLIVEIVKPGTNDPLPDGHVGEVVVTRLNADYPLLRFGTEDLSAALAGQSSCGRTNMRLAGFLGNAARPAEIAGKSIDPAAIAEIGKRLPDVGRLRLVVGSKAPDEVMILKVESKTDSPWLREKLAHTLQSVTQLPGRVEIVAPGTLPNDGQIICDERVGRTTESTHA